MIAFDCLFFTLTLNVLNIKFKEKRRCDTPAHQETPRYSTMAPSANSSKAPLPATSESPMAATTSISPGLSLCTDVGTCRLRPQGTESWQGKGVAGDMVR